MSEALPVFYWDACIFIERLKQEAVTPQKRQAITKILASNKARANIICTSAVTHLECLPKKLNHHDASRENDYRAMFGSRFFYDIPIGTQVIVLAREIRDFYFREADPKTATPHRMMGLGDSIHLATAIIEGVQAFHTRDGSRKGGNVPLLGLPESSPNGMIAGQYPLEIESPEDPQTDLVDLAEEQERAAKK